MRGRARLEDAVRLLAQGSGAKLLAGGQSLGPMLNLRSCSRACSSTSRALPELARSRGCGRCRRRSAPASRTPRSRTGASPDPIGGMLAEVARRHRLSRGAQPRHDRRQPRPCRSRRRLALLPDGARRRGAAHSAPRGGGGSRSTTSCAAPSRRSSAGRDPATACASASFRRGRAGAIPRFAARPASSPMRSAPWCTIPSAARFASSRRDARRAHHDRRGARPASPRARRCLRARAGSAPASLSGGPRATMPMSCNIHHGRAQARARQGARVMTKR